MISDETAYRRYLDGEQNAADLLVERYGDALTLYINGYIKEIPIIVIITPISLKPRLNSINSFFIPVLIIFLSFLSLLFPYRSVQASCFLLRKAIT